MIDLDATREIHIGAYARRQWRRRLLLGSFGAVLLIAAIALYIYLRPDGPRPVIRSGRAVMVRCEACRREETIMVGARQTFPIECPQCGAPAAVELWICRACKHRFVPQAGAEDLVCPECGSDQVGSAAAP